MIDTFRPLKVVKKAQQMEDANYQYSWVRIIKEYNVLLL